MFDHWDHTVQAGNDSEYALVILALCVGVAYSFARLILKSPLAFCIARVVFTSSVHFSLLFTHCSFSSLLLNAASPPAFALRT